MLSLPFKQQLTKQKQNESKKSVIKRQQIQNITNQIIWGQLYILKLFSPNKVFEKVQEQNDSLPLDFGQSLQIFSIVHSYSQVINSIIIVLIIFKMSRVELNNLIDQITTNQKFLAQVQRCVEGVHRVSGEKQQLPTFAFQTAGKYPWSIVEGNLPVEGQKMIEQITDMFGMIIDNQLHQILNREFLNISNEFLVIRDQMTQFTKEEEQKRLKMREEFNQQIQTIKRKMIVQQSMNVGPKEFVRTRATGMLNSSISSIASNDGRSEVRMEVEALRKQVQMMKRQINKSEIMHTVNDKLVYLEEHFKHEITDLKIKIESIKQKTQRNYNQLAAKMNESNNRQYLNSEVKRAVKVHFKIYLEEINFCKQSIIKVQDSIPKLDKSLQEYVANQLKALWVVVGNMKRRVESIEQQANLHNQSFMME